MTAGAGAADGSGAAEGSGAAAGWAPDRLPDLRGRTAVVTGANSGLGLATSTALAAAGASVVMTSRDAQRGRTAADAVLSRVPGARVEVRPLDLASLDSVAGFAADLDRDLDALHLLVNNAGVMATPLRRTADGFELQLGTNHLGHFALTGRLLRLLRAAEPADVRVVTVSSLAHNAGTIDRADLNWERRYRRWPAYGRSKLANLLFTYELARRLATAGSSVRAVAAHPGLAASNLFSGSFLGLPAVVGRAGNALASVVAQPAAAGAWPTLRAATDPEVQSGEYLGPGGLGESRGPATRVRSSAAAHSLDDAGWLWQESERLTGTVFDLPS